MDFDDEDLIEKCEEKCDRSMLKEIGKIALIVSICVLAFFVGFHDGYVTAEHNIYSEIIVENGGVTVGDTVTATTSFSSMEGVVIDITTGQGITMVWLYNESDGTTDFFDINYVEEYQKNKYDTVIEVRNAIDG